MGEVTRKGKVTARCLTRGIIIDIKTGYLILHIFSPNFSLLSLFFILLLNHLPLNPPFYQSTGNTHHASPLYDANRHPDRRRRRRRIRPIASSVRKFPSFIDVEPNVLTVMIRLDSALSQASADVAPSVSGYFLVASSYPGFNSATRAGESGMGSSGCLYRLNYFFHLLLFSLECKFRFIPPSQKR